MAGFTVVAVGASVGTAGGASAGGSGRMTSLANAMPQAAATLEDIIRTLHPDVDLVGIARPFLDQIVKDKNA
jgi:hypothetical protein